MRVSRSLQAGQKLEQRWQRRIKPAGAEREHSLCASPRSGHWGYSGELDKASTELPFQWERQTNTSSHFLHRTMVRTQRVERPLWGVDEVRMEPMKLSVALWEAGVLKAKAEITWRGRGVRNPGRARR